MISIEEQNNPVDVQYKECRFQIKEIPDDVKRYRDIKQTYDALEKADKDKIDGSISVHDRSPYQTAWERVTNKLEQIEKSYSNKMDWIYFFILPIHQLNYSILTIFLERKN